VVTTPSNVGRRQPRVGDRRERALDGEVEARDAGAPTDAADADAGDDRPLLGRLHHPAAIGSKTSGSTRHRGARRAPARQSRCAARRARHRLMLVGMRRSSCSASTTIAITLGGATSGWNWCMFTVNVYTVPVAAHRCHRQRSPTGVAPVDRLRCPAAARVAALDEQLTGRPAAVEVAVRVGDGRQHPRRGRLDDRPLGHRRTLPDTTVKCRSSADPVVFLAPAIRIRIAGARKHGRGVQAARGDLQGGQAAEQRVGAVRDGLVGHQLDVGGELGEQLERELHLEPAERRAQAVVADPCRTRGAGRPRVGRRETSRSRRRTATGRGRRRRSTADTLLPAGTASPPISASTFAMRRW